jgi:hypothetical protein
LRRWGDRPGDISAMIVEHARGNPPAAEPGGDCDPTKNYFPQRPFSHSIHVPVRTTAKIIHPGRQMFADASDEIAQMSPFSPV